MSIPVSFNKDSLNLGNIPRDSMANLYKSLSSINSFCAPNMPPALYEACLPGTSRSMIAMS